MKIVNNVIGAYAFLLLGALIRLEEDSFHAESLRPVDIAVHVVTHI